MAEQTTMAAEPLTDRLDALMMRLDQEGRLYDANLVHEAIEALARPKVVGTPWTAPLKGDKCTRLDGKSREAVQATYHSMMYGTVRESPAPGWWASLVRYRDQNGREDTVGASSWATWCRAACRAGGTYERAEATS